MKYVRFRLDDGTEHYGQLEGRQIKVLAGDLFDTNKKLTGTDYNLDEVKLLSPVQPGKLVCVGLNYRLHAKESNMSVPEEPMLFMCSPEAIIAHGETIVLDNDQDRIDFEAEIGIVVGKKCKNVPASQAKEYIFGYTCANDVSNRDLQKKDIQFTRAKSFDTYKPLGPCIATDIDPDNVAIKLWQNGQLKQSSNTNDMIFSTGQLFEFISSIMTLNPGDVIITGTPSGVAPMKAGDTILIEIEGIGQLENKVK